jgi:hypothetical protein
VFIKAAVAVVVYYYIERLEDDSEDKRVLIRQKRAKRGASNRKSINQIKTANDTDFRSALFRIAAELQDDLDLLLFKDLPVLRGAIFKNRTRGHVLLDTRGIGRRTTLV